MQNRLRATWDAGDKALNAWLAIPSSVTAELVAGHDFDAVTLDLQHGLIDYQAAVPMLQAMAASAAAPMVRVPWLEPGIIMKVLDAGALGIVCPMVNRREDAEELVSYTHYAPIGTRSFGPFRAQMIYGADYHHHANQSVVTLAMIETAEALTNVEEIARTPGLTGLYIGPSDLGLSMGHEARLDQEEAAVLEAISAILEAAHAAGIKAGIHCLEPDYARRMHELGFDLVTVSSDLRLLGEAYAGVISAMRG